MEEELLQIELENKLVTLKIVPFDGDIDVEEILKIDYSNIIGECLTFVVIYNRVANLRAECESTVKTQKFALETLEAQLKEEYRNKLDGRGGKKVTVDEVNTAVILDSRYQDRRRFLIEREKEFAYLDNLYWTAQVKSNLLQRLSDKLVPTDFSNELLESSVNGVMIKMSKKVIK